MRLPVLGGAACVFALAAVAPSSGAEQLTLDRVQDLIRHHAAEVLTVQTADQALWARNWGPAVSATSQRVLALTPATGPQRPVAVFMRLSRSA